MKRAKDADQVTAVLYLEVEYEKLPDGTEITELVEKAREYGYPRVAKLKILRETEVDYA